MGTSSALTGFKRLRCHRIGATALLGLLLSGQAWSSVSVSPAPSYDGDYTVSFSDTPLGCRLEDSGYGFNIQYCSTLYETGSSSGNWSSPGYATSKAFTNKYNGTYSYQVYTTVTVFGSTSGYWSNTASVQVSRPPPVPNDYYYIYQGSAPHPYSYIYGWAATGADGCYVELQYFDVFNTYYGSMWITGLPSTYYVGVYDNYFGYSILGGHVDAFVICSGPGGSAYETSRLNF